MNEAVIALLASGITAAAGIGTVLFRDRLTAQRSIAARERERIEYVYRHLGAMSKHMSEADDLAFWFFEPEQKGPLGNLEQAEAFRNKIIDAGQTLQEISTVQGLYMHDLAEPHAKLALSYGRYQNALHHVLFRAKPNDDRADGEILGHARECRREFSEIWQAYRDDLENKVVP